MNKYLHRFLNEFVVMGGMYRPPESSGLDGYDLILNGNHIFISGKQVAEAESEAINLRTGVVREDVLFSLPFHMAQEARYARFKEALTHSIKQ